MPMLFHLHFIKFHFRHFSLDVFRRITWFKRILTLLNVWTVYAQTLSNFILRDIMRTAARTLLLFAFGIANATEDQVTNGKHTHPSLYYYALNLSW